MVKKIINIIIKERKKCFIVFKTLLYIYIIHLDNS